MKGIPFHRRIGFIFASICIMASLTIGMISVIYIDSSSDNIINEIRETLSNNALVTMQTYLDYCELESQIACEKLIENSDIIASCEKKDSVELAKLAVEMIRNIGLNVNFVTFVDERGDVIARLHSDKTGDSILFQRNIISALAGVKSTHIESGAEIKISVRTGAPIRNCKGHIIGAVSTGYSFTDPAFVNRLKSMTSNEFSVFIGDERANTTIMQSEQSAVGSKMDDKIVKEVLKKRRTYTGTIDIIDIPYVVAYRPILDSGGNVLGALATGTSMKEIINLRQKAVLKAVALELIFVTIIIAFMLIYVRRTITGPLTDIAMTADQIAHGNLEIEIPHKFKSELGILADAFRAMIGQLKCNIENLKIQKEHLADALQDAEKAEIAKAQFLANMSHEIRTPMNAILGMSHLALETELSEKQREYIATIHRFSTLLIRIINDILDFSKMESGKMTIEETEFNLRSVVEDGLMFIRMQADEKKLEFDCNISEDIPEYIIGDPLRLSEIVYNLADNAVKFTEKGRIDISMRTIRRTDKKIKLQMIVEDTGIGMDANQIKRLFGAFEQADRSTTRRYGGTGLGLAICKGLAELMGGNLHAVSDMGKGSRFIFTAWFEIDSKDNKKDTYTKLL
ncbi:MAG TPA: ATP-binding protein, partial [Anaerovoracaceae bacterium]|nr:ATP-binding protein [Anaerovoracaceae bacterium]